MIAPSHAPQCEVAHCQKAIRRRDYLEESDGSLAPTPLRARFAAAARRRFRFGARDRRPDRDRGPDRRRRARRQGGAGALRGRRAGARDRHEGNRDRRQDHRLRGDGDQRRLRPARLRGARRQAPRGPQRDARGRQRRDRQAHRRELRHRSRRLGPGRDQGDARDGDPASAAGAAEAADDRGPEQPARGRADPLRQADARGGGAPPQGAHRVFARATARRTARCTRRSGS